MASDDWAIVVGIAKYPSFGETEQDARDLHGPDDDATDVVAWLRDSRGGAVPAAQIRVVRTTLTPVGVNGAAWPPREAILSEFDDLERRSQQNQQVGRGARIGRRLYVYASGHGFARKRKEGAVFAANATKVRRHHVFASAWFEWFANAGYFDEAVLWMDTCMWPDSTTPLESVGYRQVIATTGGTKMFSAYAARFPLQAIERPVSGGAVRGVFTQTLLEGLRGGAAEPVNGQVRSSTLRNYLTNHLRDRFTTEDRQDGLISQEPDFGFDDELIFCTLPAVSPTTVTLHGFPPASESQSATIVSGSPPALVAQATVQQGQAVVALVPGLYFLQMATPVLAKGFQVPGGSHVSIDLRT